MRSIRSALLCTILAFLALVSPTIMATSSTMPELQTSILENPGFETGDKSDWTGYGGRIEVITDDVHSGKYACRAWLDQDWGGGLFTTFQAQKGKYFVRMWIKASPSTAQCWVGADKFGGSKISLPIKERATWVKAEFEVRLKSNSCELYAWAPKAPDGWIMIDDIEVTPTSM